MPQLNNSVALMTGASRGAGRGVALELGAAGATVYVTGRSVDGGAITGDVPGTIDATAREVSDRGGRGVAVRCDHTIDADIESLTQSSSVTALGGACSARPKAGARSRKATATGSSTIRSCTPRRSWACC